MKILKFLGLTFIFPNGEKLESEKFMKTVIESEVGKTTSLNVMVTVDRKGNEQMTAVATTEKNEIPSP